jgi:putative hemolysin
MNVLPNLLPLLLLLLFLLLSSAFFSSAETALFSLNPIQIRRIGKRHADAAAGIERMLRKPMPLLSTILIGNTLVNIAAVAVGYALARRVLPGRPEALSVPVMTFLLVIFGEVSPKRLAMRHAEYLAIQYSGIFRILIPAFTPFRFLLEKTAGLFQKNLRGADRRLTEEEILTVVEVGEEEGVLDKDERNMVDGIIGLEDIEARDVMTPRVDLEGIDLEDAPEESARIAALAHYHYLPLYRGTLDHIEGFLDVRGYLLADRKDLRPHTLPARFVPETVPLDTLLRQFQKDKQRVAVVADEFGGTAGLITRGDILEEIVPDVGSEFGEEKPDIRPLGADRWLVDGKTSLEEINYELDMHLEDDGADRIAGWVAAQAERIPRAGETVVAQGCRATVQRVRKQRVTQVLLEKLAEPPEPVEDVFGREEV